MSDLKGTEKFVAENLKLHFSKLFTNVSFEEGDDPPDIYLNVDRQKIAVEITDIDQNVLKNRKTIDYGYLNFIDNIDKEFGHLVDKDKKIFIFFYHDYVKVSTISKKFKKYFSNLLKSNALVIGNDIEDAINEVNFKISILPMPEKGTRKIVGSAMPFGGKVKKSRNITDTLEIISDCHLDGQTFNIINNRILDKTEKCKHIKETKWLALFDNYYNKFTYFNNNKHLEHYQNVFQDIKDFGIFDKILVVFENKDVLEFTHNKSLERNI